MKAIAHTLLIILIFIMFGCASPIQIATTTIQAQHSLILAADKTLAHWYTVQSNKCYEQAINVRDTIKPRKDGITKAKESYDKCIAKPDDIAIKITKLTDLLYAENKIAAQLVLDVINKKSPVEMLGNISKKGLEMVTELQSMMVLYKIGAE